MRDIYEDIERRDNQKDKNTDDEEEERKKNRILDLMELRDRIILRLFVGKKWQKIIIN